MLQSLAPRRDARSAPPAKKPKSGKTRARAVLEKPAQQQGWLSTDAEEVERRRWRGATEIVAIEEMEAEHSPHGTFRSRSDSGGAYEVEIRSLDGLSNSCGCIDHR